MADWENLRGLMRAALDGSDASWHALLTELGPIITQFARRQPIGRLREREDSAREILTRVIARLRNDDLAALRAYFERSPDAHPRAFLRILTRRSAIDYMREQPEFVRGDAPGWITLVSFVTRDGKTVPDTLAAKRREVIRFMTEAIDEVTALGDDGDTEALARRWSVPPVHVRRLAKKGELLMAVFRGTLEGRSQTELATTLDVGRREVQLAIQYTEEFLNARGFGR